MSRIALVDDDRNILTSVSMTLEAEGFDVETYNDGQAALDAFNKQLPDMAVLDIKMPRMDGMDLLQRLRQKSAMPVTRAYSCVNSCVRMCSGVVIWPIRGNARPTATHKTRMIHQ